MAGAGIRIDMHELQDLQNRLDEIGGFNRRELLEVVGATVESQTRRRISEEKTGPDGDAWPAWSEEYAATRHGGHSLLIGEGDLLDSIGYLVGTNDVEVGSNLIYFATHHFGDDDRNISQREVLGLSADNEEDLNQDIEDWFQELLS